jgi:hypothetical protein
MPFDNRGDEHDEDAVLAQPSVPPAANVGTNTGPAAVEQQFPPDVEPQAVTDEAPSPEGERAGDGESAPSFDSRWTQEFEGLMYLGRLTEDFHYLGHHFRLRTMTVDEVLECGLVCKPYTGTLAEVKAYQAAVVAGCLESVDGKPLPIPITNRTTDTALANRFDWVNRHFFPPVLDAIYERYLILEAKVREVMASLGEASG